MTLPDLHITYYVVYGMVDVSLLHNYVCTMSLTMSKIMSGNDDDDDNNGDNGGDNDI